MAKGSHVYNSPINWGPASFITKTVDGTFPDYGRVIPAGNDKTVVVRPSWLAGAIGAVTAISDMKRAVRCTFEAGKVLLSTADPSVGSGAMEIECRYDGEPLTIGFNPGLLVDMLAKAAPDKGDVTLKLADAGSPVLITGSIEGWCGVLMPMRV